MRRKRHTPEQVVRKLREAEADLALGTGEQLGKPPTHKTVSLASIRIDRFENGKIAEHWSVVDVAGLMKQIDTPA